MSYTIVSIHFIYQAFKRHWASRSFVSIGAFVSPQFHSLQYIYAMSGTFHKQLDFGSKNEHFTWCDFSFSHSHKILCTCIFQIISQRWFLSKRRRYMYCRPHMDILRLSFKFFPFCISFAVNTSADTSGAHYLWPSTSLTITPVSYLFTHLQRVYISYTLLYIPLPWCLISCS